MAQQNTQIPGFPDPVGGRSKLQIVDHAGPASYTTGGETFPQQSVYGGPNSIGLSGVLWCNGGHTESGNYYVVPVFGGGGKVSGTIKLLWYTNAAAGAGGAQVASTTNLSAEKVRLLVIGG
jgi:hypothetical protein